MEVLIHTITWAINTAGQLKVASCKKLDSSIHRIQVNSDRVIPEFNEEMTLVDLAALAIEHKDIKLLPVGVYGAIGAIPRGFEVNLFETLVNQGLIVPKGSVC